MGWCSAWGEANMSWLNHHGPTNHEGVIMQQSSPTDV